MSYEWFPMPEELYEQLWWWWNNRTIKDSPYVFTADQIGPHYGFEGRSSDYKFLEISGQ